MDLHDFSQFGRYNFYEYSQRLGPGSQLFQDVCGLQMLEDAWNPLMEIWGNRCEIPRAGCDDSNMLRRSILRHPLGGYAPSAVQVSVGSHSLNYRSWHNTPITGRLLWRHNGLPLPNRDASLLKAIKLNKALMDLSRCIQFLPMIKVSRYPKGHQISPDTIWFTISLNPLWPLWKFPCQRKQQQQQQQQPPQPQPQPQPQSQPHVMWVCLKIVYPLNPQG